MHVCRQWSGVNGVTFFAPQIFAGIRSLGQGNKGSLIAAILVNGVQLIATIFTVVMVDKVGRRSLLLSGSMLGFAAEVAVAITLAVSASTSAVDLPLAASVVSIVLVSPPSYLSSHISSCICHNVCLLSPHPEPLKKLQLRTCYKPGSQTDLKAAG